MSKFLTKDQIYRILQRELPEDAYADGSPSAFFTTADNYAVADSLGRAYSNLEKIYNNIFPLSADENIQEWEETVFDIPQPALPTLQERRDRIVAKLRQQIGISMWDILTLAASFVPEGVYVQILEPGCKDAWRLNVSKFNIDTYLGINFTPKYTIGDVCAGVNPAWRLGESKLNINTYLTSSDRVATYAQAYTYILKIYDYTLSDDQFLLLNVTLSKFEPARSPRKVFQNVSLAALGWNTVVSGVDRFSGFNMITRNNLSPTGYDGRTL